MSRLFKALRAPEENTAAWYLRTNDQTVYGPVTLATLASWAAQNRIAPGNRVSVDGRDWQPAEAVPDLGMDWMADRPADRPHGPFNLRAAPELVRGGHIPPDAVLVNRSTGERVPVRELMESESRQMELDSFLSLAFGEHEPVDCPSRRRTAPPKPEPPIPPAVESGGAELPLEVPTAPMESEAGTPDGPGVEKTLRAEIERLRILLNAERARTARREENRADGQTHLGSLPDAR